MGNLNDTDMEKGLVKLGYMYSNKNQVFLEEYQKIQLYVYDQEIIKNFFRECKFKDIGNVYDFPEILPQPESISGMDLTADYKLFQRIAVSKKFNSIMFYNVDRYSIGCIFLIDLEYLKKFAKKSKAILRHDSGANIFRGTNFSCGPKEYIEICDAIEDKTKPIDILEKKVVDENLVFDADSAIVSVMSDITTFFTKETQDLYAKLQLSYKRGIILFGDPGNGKSAMIREIIRNIPDIIKVVINPNVNGVTRILQSLTKALDSKKAIVIIEDIDSLITDRNRSEFLNILDGVDIRSGLFFIGTTNYPDQIDPAFMNRSGRFDRTIKIDNPSEPTRKIFFESRKIGKLFSEYKVFKDDAIVDSDSGVVDLFVKHSDDLPMASLKELITSTSYILASNTEMTIEEAVEKSYKSLTSSRTEHADSHNRFKSRRAKMMNRYDDDDDD